MVGVVDRPKKRPEVNPCTEGKVSVEHDDRDLIALARPGRTVKEQVKPVRRPDHQPSMVRALAVLNRVSYDDSGSTVSGVEHTADGVVKRGLGVETTTCRVTEPVDEAVEKTAKAIGRVPLPRRVKVEAQAMSLEYVRMMKEPEVIDFHTRWCQTGCTDGDGELLVITKRHPSANARYVGGPKPQTQPHPPGLVEPRAPHHLDVTWERLSDGVQLGQGLALPVTEASLAHPARPDRLTVAAPAAPAVPTVPYFPLDVEDFGAVKPSPNKSCHFFTLSSKSVSS